MVFKTKKMLLNVVREVFSGEANDVYICNDINNKVLSYYTLHLIKDHKIARILLSAFHTENILNTDDNVSNTLIECFTYEDNVCLVFPYNEERLLNQFYMGKILKLHQCESICINLVINCLSSDIPSSVLYLILKQNQVNLGKDAGIYFSYNLDFKDFDSLKTENDCVTKCAELIVSLLSQLKYKNIKSLELIKKKISKEGYESFTELYKDIKVTAAPEKSSGIFKRIKAFISRNKDKLFKILLVVSITLLICAIVVLISQLFFSNSSIFRLFTNTFRDIGTESLLK